MKRSVTSTYLYLVKWFILAVVSGITGSLLVRSFFLLSTSIQSFFRIIPVPLFLWPALGAIIAGALIYRIEPHASGEGIPSYIRGLTEGKGKFSFSVTFFKYWAALATISTFGNGGILGPLGRVSAGLMSYLTRKMKRIFKHEDWRTAGICGLAAVTGSIFQSSIGGGLFAVEIIQRAKIGYKDIFPAILASSASVYIFRLFRWSPFYEIHASQEFMDLSWIWALLILAGVSGAVGGLFIKTYALATRIFKRTHGIVLLKVIIGSLLAGTVAWALNPELLGTSNSMISAVFDMDRTLLAGNLSSTVPLVLVLIIMMLAKALANSVTVGSGMSAGFTGPAAIMGLLLGAASAELLGIPLGSGTYHAFIAVGFCGVLTASMNIPLSAAIMTMEIFGPVYSLPAALAAIIGFQVTRAQTIYDYALQQPYADER